MIPETLSALAVPIDSLTPYQDNLRRGDLEAIKESLSVNGQYRPIVANRRTGEVLAGNHTLRAAEQLGWSGAPRPHPRGPVAQGHEGGPGGDRPDTPALGTPTAAARTT